MGSKLKGLRKKAAFKQVAPGTVRVSGDDALMLSAAKSAVTHSDGVDELAASSVLVISDVRDRIGAEIAARSLKQTVDELRDSILPGEEPGETNPTPFVATWEPRAGLATLLTTLGFDVPADWAPLLARPPREPGSFWILLKRDGRGLLLETDLAGMSVLPGPALKFR
jgi:hypothetical protein